MTKTELARVPSVDMKEARKIANEMNISVTAALQLHYRRKFGEPKWKEF